MPYHLALVPLLLLFSSLARAELVLSAAPRESAAEGVKTYGALATRLSSVLGEKVVYRHPKNWAEYADKIRRNEYDILFDGPHLTAWRMRHTGFAPVARLPGELSFDVVVRKPSEDFNNIAALRWARVCAYATPNLTASVLLDRYRNEVAVPTIVPIRGNMWNIHQALTERKCNAAVLRKQFYEKKLSADEKGRLKIIYQTRKFPNQGFSVSKRVDTAQREKLEALLLQGDPSLKPIFIRFAKKTNRFVASRDEEYQGISKLLEGIVWGW